MLFTADGKLIDSCRGVDTFTPTLQPKRGVLEASGDGYVLMVDSPWEHIPLKSSSNEQKSHLSICLDIYCPSQHVYLRQELASHGFYTVEQAILRHVRENEQLVEKIERFPEAYGNKVTYLEDPYFFNDWHGFAHYANGSEKVFAMEKNFSGNTGLKVVNQAKLATKLEIVRLEPGEFKIYLLKRTQAQVKYIPDGKVLPSPSDAP